MFWRRQPQPQPTSSASLSKCAERETKATIAELRLLTEQLEVLAQTLAKKTSRSSDD